MKLCECGCGQYTPIAGRSRPERGITKGQSMRFIKGHTFKKEKVKLICDNCKRKFEVIASYKHRNFCSKGCATSYRRRHPEGTLVETHGYLRVKISDHPNANKAGYIYYHRYVLEQHLGYVLDKSYDVHHIDEDKKNNNVSNLVAIKHSAHLTLHLLKRHREKREANAVRRNDC